MPSQLGVQSGENLATPDDALVRRQAGGSQVAAAELYERYAERIRKLVRAKLSREVATRLDADDIVQSVFRRFFRANQREAYVLPSDVTLWELLLTITLNRLRSAEQYHRAQKRNIAQSAALDNFEQVASTSDRADSESLEFIVTEALELLPQSHRAVVRFRLDGYDVTEIANQLGRSKRTIERMLQEVRHQLRHILELETPHDDLSDTLPL